MRGCGRCFCASCGEEMIHRDNRRGYEASSALNQIFHREGPVQITVGDVDTYSIKLIGNQTMLRLVEHKQPAQPLKPMQSLALGLLHNCIEHCAQESLFGLSEGSGVFVMRGQLTAQMEGRRKVDFGGPQTVETLKGALVLEPKSRDELWTWFCCDRPWTRRNETW